MDKKEEKRDKEDGTVWGWIVLIILWLVLVIGYALAFGHLFDRWFNGRGY